MRSLPRDAEAFCRKLEEEGLLVDDPVDAPRVVLHDPNDDDYLVVLAQTTETAILVTRARHFEEVDVEGLRIIRPGAQSLRLDEFRWLPILTESRPSGRVDP
jgi:hypothetical protein